MRVVDTVELPAGGMPGRRSLMLSVRRLVVRRDLSHPFTLSLSHAAQG
jgi:hypothetical protein